jgi:hypothetical protein
MLGGPHRTLSVSKGTLATCVRVGQAGAAGREGAHQDVQRPPRHPRNINHVPNTPFGHGRALARPAQRAKPAARARRSRAFPRSGLRAYRAKQDPWQGSVVAAGTPRAGRQPCPQSTSKPPASRTTTSHPSENNDQRSSTATASPPLHADSSRSIQEYWPVKYPHSSDDNASATN